MATPSPTDDAVLEPDGLDLEILWHQHKSRILLWAAAIIVVVGGSLAWYVTSVLSSRAAEAALAGATDAAAFEAVVKKYQGTMPAASASLLLASALRDSGNLAGSTDAFQQFLKDYPSHPLAGGALFGIAQNQDAAGDSAAAAVTLAQVAERYPTSYAAPFARYVLAEIHLRDFRRDEARSLLETIQAESPGSLVARMAAAQLARLSAAGK